MTVAFLAAASHLHTEGAGISDEKCDKIMDEIAPEKADEMRRSANLQKDSFLNPSQMQSFLMRQNIIKESDFADVIGGNIMDSEHISSFLNVLENASTKKTSAALYFHEHCVAILKVVLTDGTCWYDLIESMPQLHQNGKWAATRTRCYDRASLETLLTWYACSKFSPTDEKYIDDNPWTDSKFEDIRVFQAFVMKE